MIYKFILNGGKIFLLSFVCLIICSYSCLAQDSRLKKLTATLIAAINTRQAEQVLPLLDDSCRISTFPRGMNKVLLVTILDERFSIINDYKIIENAAEGSSNRIKLRVVYANGKTGNPDFLFGADGKVLELNIVKRKMPVTTNKNATQILHGDIPDHVELNMQIVDKLIFIAAEVNGKQGLLQFDSGSIFTILNQQEFSSQSHLSTAPGEVVTGINGASSLGSLTLDSLKMGELFIRNFNVRTLAGAGKDGSLGLFGFDVISDFEVTLDYKKKLLGLQKLDSAGNYVNRKTTKRKPKLIFPVSMQRHIPIIKLAIGGRQYSMGLDCGANSNLLFEENYEGLKPFLTEESEVDMLGLGDQITIVKSAKVKTGNVGPLRFKDMATVFTKNNMANSSMPDRLRIDGILGYPFLSQYEISINFKKGEVYFF